MLKASLLHFPKHVKGNFNFFILTLWDKKNQDPRTLVMRGFPLILFLFNPGQFFPGPAGWRQWFLE